jgi:vacuolar iron transporter family protein
MRRIRLHPQGRLIGRMGWLRAAVLGANDGIVSTASLTVRLAWPAASWRTILIAGVLALVAEVISGALAMAVTAGDGDFAGIAA